jgi:hypothetical protein
MDIMENKTSSGNVHYKPLFKFGLGGVPLGNEFAVVTDKDAYAIMESAWSWTSWTISTCCRTSRNRNVSL